MPMLAEAADELKGDTKFLGINVRDSSADQGLAFERGLDVGYPSLYAPDGKALLAFSGKISLTSIPNTAILDREGRVAAVIAGPIPSKLTLTELIEDVAAEPADG
jgi:hypothetical protein